jgi:glycosyltransferase involved in cell wall biosynthesis
MVLVEAMSQGTAAVTFDCPRGPSEIVTSGRNGEVVPDGDVPALTATLTRLLDDEEARRRLGEQALRDSAAYAMHPIADRWRHLIEDVTRRT